MFRTLITVSALALSAPAALAHPTPLTQAARPDVQVETTDLGDGLFMLTGRGGNIGVLNGPDGVFVIDSQFADIAPANLAAIKEISGGDQVRFLINTHWHGDHVGGNAIFADVGATVVAHENVRARVSEDQEGVLLGQVRKTPASPEGVWPVITYARDVTFHVNGQTVQVIHAPAAHTDGDSIVKFKEANVIHTGDIMFSGLFPFIDVSSGGTVDGYIAALDLIYALADDETTIMPGHGPVSTRADVAVLADMVRETSGIVRDLVEAGQSLEDIQAAAPLADYAEDWSWGFINAERFTALLFADAQSRVR
ncbi:MAG: MBL fold metallo-hydrolase [Pseudomonadota bacterium]